MINYKGNNPDLEDSCTRCKSTNILLLKTQDKIEIDTLKNNIKSTLKASYKCTNCGNVFKSKAVSKEKLED